MAHQETYKVVKARRVRDGANVYLTSCDAWTPDIEIAEFLPEEDHDWRLAFANRLREVTGAELVLAPEELVLEAVA